MTCRNEGYDQLSMPEPTRASFQICSRPLNGVPPRLNVLLSGSRWRLPPYVPPPLGSVRPRTSGIVNNNEHSPGQPLTGLLSRSAPLADAAALYSIAEHYQHTLTLVAPRLLLGSTGSLEGPGPLRNAHVSHVLLVCSSCEVCQL